ncbi:hypothetical protein MUK42_30779 [Musa troglodytarum]|uniref:Wall-associated receptor kinase galacturonan-binding domain-containing protein n=1 Tax=Musa troglodytarum TaxID=320322 RepID=A0A9E7FTQ1_9LILI|nr:hypothetical protein MUK42_30779 [Musa troglodytarum]
MGLVNILLFLLASTSTVSVRTESRSTNATFPLPVFCPRSCGSISFEYPFGIGDGCFRTGFNLTCKNDSTSSPKLFLGDGTIEVTRIDMNQGLVYIKPPTVVMDVDESSDVNSGHCTLDLDFTIETALEIQLTRINQTELHLVNTSSIKVIMFDDKDDYLEGVLNGSTTNVEATLAWYMNDHLSCEEAKNTDTYACISQNSFCQTLFLNISIGYLCRCSTNYQVNPYVPSGCQAIKNMTTFACVDQHSSCLNTTTTDGDGEFQGYRCKCS